LQEEIVGRVFSGTGRGAFFTSLLGYKTHLAQLLGREPFPGTLNLHVIPEEAVAFLGGLHTHELASFTEDGREYGGIRLAKILINGLAAYIVISEKTHYDKTTFEIVSTENLRNKFELSDGDEVHIFS